MPNDKPGTIFARNRDDTVDAETMLWRARCDKPKSIRKYITDDAIMVEPDNKMYSPNTDPTLDDYLEDYEPWTAFRINDEKREFVEIDMMSSALSYHVTAWRQDAQGQMIPTEAICTTVWRQGAGGDFKCCLHHMTKIPGDGKQNQQQEQQQTNGN